MWAIRTKRALLVGVGLAAFATVLASCEEDVNDDQPAQNVSPVASAAATNTGPDIDTNPAQILSGGQLAAYNSLKEEKKKQFNELLPEALRDVHPEDRVQAVGVFASMAKRSQDHLQAMKEEPLIKLPPLRETLSSQELEKLDALDHRLRETFIWWWEEYREAETYVEPGDIEFLVAHRRMVLASLPNRELVAEDFLLPDSVAELSSFSKEAQDYFWRAIAGQMTQGSAFWPDPDTGTCCEVLEPNWDLDPDYLKAFAAWQLEFARHLNDPTTGEPSSDFVYDSNP